MEVNIPGIEGIGSTLIYLVDQVRDDLSVYDIDFKTIPSTSEKTHGSLSHFHEFTIQIDPDRTQTCLTFFERLFGFQAKDEASLQLPGKHAASLRFVESSAEQHNTEFFSKITFKANENSPLRHQAFTNDDRAFAIEVI
ncbi:MULTISPECIES: hypothetical protein [Marinomonas]|uniref:Uncharacterized protein n=2 Tax=Marinomonas TaxID=28253 RepID=A0ABT3KDS1_9GAMM|nr:hypothetical protein [Marinomonas sp. KJ51-3]MCW4628686.1 hypothetical protein [Marinomonas sp. KJ51-3]